MKLIAAALLILAPLVAQQITPNNVNPNNKQGRGSKFVTGATNSGKIGAPLCNDQNGSATTTGCTPVVTTTPYNFTGQNLSVAVTGSTPSTITLTPCPWGVNGSDSIHYLYITDTVNSEKVLITGGTCTSGATTGTVQFTPTYSHNTSATIGSASGGIREAVSASISSGRYGIWVPAGSLTIHGQLYFPPGVSARVLVDADLTFGSDIGASDGIWIDSCEACTIDVTGSVGYQGSGYAVRLNPKNPAPSDNIKNIQWSYIRFNNIQSYPNGGSPQSGVPIAQANVRMLLEGDVASPLQGLIAHNLFYFPSLWGALTSFVVDNAATTYPGSFEENEIHVTQVVLYTQLGMRTCNVGAALCANNLWDISVLYGRDDGTGTAPQAGLNTGQNTVGGIWDVASFSQPGGKNSITFGSGTSNVAIRTAGTPGGTVVNSSGNGTNTVFSNVGQIYPSAAGRFTVTPSGSPYVCQNLTRHPMQIVVTGGTVSTFGYSADGASYDNYNIPSNSPFTLLPGMYSKTTYTVAPTMFIYCPPSANACQCN